MKDERNEIWNWRCFRAGGVVQIDFRDAADLQRLKTLDLKLWMALTIPTYGLQCDARTLDALDTDGDKRIRPPELLEAVRWMCDILVDPDDLFREGDTITVGMLQLGSVQTATRRILAQCNKKEHDPLSPVDLELIIDKLAQAPFNGDGIIVAESASDPILAQLIADIVEHYGSVVDRSGKLGIDAALTEAFFQEIALQLAWLNEAANDAMIAPLGIAQTEDAFLKCESMRAKIDDYFVRCALAEYDPRSLSALNRLETAYEALAMGKISESTAELAAFPLVQIVLGKPLSLTLNVNPAWRSLLGDFREATIKPLLGEACDTLSKDDWLAIQAKLVPYGEWLHRRPNNKAAVFEISWLRRLQNISNPQEKILELISRDKELAPENAGLAEVQRALLFRRDLIKVIRNFVNFADFYGRCGAIFQVGTLYVDGRAAELCIEVFDPVKHSMMAHFSNAFVVYCECVRSQTPTRNIVALITFGDSDNIMVGRRGVFYDRVGLDWDATITKVVSNPISLMEAFWLPYKKLTRFVEEQIAKRCDRHGRKRMGASPISALEGGNE